MMISITRQLLFVTATILVVCVTLNPRGSVAAPGIPVDDNITICAQVSATPTFRVVSTKDPSIEIRFNYRCMVRDVTTGVACDHRFTQKILGKDLDLAVGGYRCDFESIRYELTLPSGKTHTLMLRDTMKNTGVETAAHFDLNTYTVFYSDLAEAKAERQSLRYVWKETPPSLSRPGAYTFRAYGVFCHNTGQMPDIPYTSTVARCVVDASALSRGQLRQRATGWLQEERHIPAPPNLHVVENTNGYRVVTCTIGKDQIPEEDVPPEQRKQGWNYGGMRFRLTLTPEGELLSTTNHPMYWIH